MREPPDLVAAIRRGDTAALEAVVRDCLPALLRTARAAGLTSDRAGDAVQASLLVFVQRAGEFDGRSRACTWIHGILWRKIWEERRGARRESRHDDIDGLVESRFDASGRWSRPPQGPAEALVRGEFRRELDNCLGDLPDRQRVAFTLREVEGPFRARNGLRECLESKGWTLQPYGYRVLDEDSYELCATFDREGSEPEGRAITGFWAHPAGRHCFELEARVRR